MSAFGSVVEQKLMASAVVAGNGTNWVEKGLSASCNETEEADVQFNPEQLRQGASKRRSSRSALTPKSAIRSFSAKRPKFLAAKQRVDDGKPPNSVMVARPKIVVMLKNVIPQQAHLCKPNWSYQCIIYSLSPSFSRSPRRLQLLH